MKTEPHAVLGVSVLPASTMSLTWFMMAKGRITFNMKLLLAAQSTPHNYGL